MIQTILVDRAMIQLMKQVLLAMPMKMMKQAKAMIVMMKLEREMTMMTHQAKEMIRIIHRVKELMKKMKILNLKLDII
jgi:predicted Co/Zn/Cd cation transporter (cation efflux family)